MSKNLKLEIEKEPDKSVTASESYNTIYQRENNKLKIEEKTDFNKFKRNIVVFSMIVTLIWIIVILYVLSAQMFWAKGTLSTSVIITLLTTAMGNMMFMIHQLVKNLFPKG